MVDDDESALGCYRAFLRAEGFSVEVARNAEDALALLQRIPFNLVLTDLILPDSSGVQLLEMVRCRGVRTPFAVITGFGSLQSAIEAMRLGAVDYVEKPITRDELVDLVQRALKRCRPNLSDSAPAIDVTPHAARRWAQLVVKILDSPSDIRTLKAWAYHAAVSVGVLKSSCRLADVSARRSLLMARLTRAMIASKRLGVSAKDCLDVNDHRTIVVWFRLAGMAPLDYEVDTFLTTQRLVPAPMLVSELQRELRTSGVVSA